MDTPFRRRLLFLTVSFLLFLQIPMQLCAVQAADPDNSSSSFVCEAPSAILIEASTGTVLYEKEADTRMAPASITKIMTLLLIFEALDEGKIQAKSPVTVSEHAASMGGSQVFLEAGESQTVETMIKCIAVASANDASVAMGEYIAGSEEAFVEQMNRKAKALDMKNTHFVNCCGLDAKNHYTSARDIALMSRELTVKHPKIFDYTGIWMDSITHVTMKGESEFTLSNTNKLLRQYEGATGLKTGSTGEAGFCLSATATRDEISLIGVVMHCESSKARVSVASSLLDYGFSRCHVYKDKNPPALSPASVKKGVSRSLLCDYADTFSAVTTEKLDPAKIKKTVTYHKKIIAPVKKGDVVGKISYSYEGDLLGTLQILAKENIAQADFFDYYKQLLLRL